MPPKEQGQGPQQGGPPPENNPGNAAGGTPGGAATGGAATGGTKGGTRPKDTKVPPPPPNPPQVLQLTPELFQQTVAAAVTAALVATQPVQAQALQAPAATSAPVLQRKEKKLAEFWTSRPVMWFRLFDGQFPATLSEDVRFNALLNHLPSSALPFVDHVLRDPGQDPFTAAKACLVKHYEVSPRDRARTLRSLTSLGDRTPSEMLFYMRSLLPGVPDNALFEAIFIDLLPADARNAAVKHDNLEDMAEAADKILAEAPTSVSSVTDRDGEEDFGVSQVERSSTKKPRDPTLCYVHARYGRKAYRCAAPRMCRMREQTIKAPSTPGKVNAGRQ